MKNLIDQRGRHKEFIIIMMTIILSGLSMLFNSTALAGYTTNDFVITVNTAITGSTTSTQFTISKTNGLTYNYNVDCNNDSTLEAVGLTGDYVCNYGSSGIYTIVISDNSGLRTGFPGISLNYTLDRNKIISIDQRGTLKFTSLISAFRGATNLVLNATDSPDLTNIINMNSMFEDTINLIDNGGAIGSWNLSGVQSLINMFKNAKKFNGSLGTWNTSTITNMDGVFRDAQVFDQPLGTWNTSKVTNMDSMFFNAHKFNQPINSWDTSKVVTMATMFSGAFEFNQSLNNWDTSRVTSMSSMFRGARAFNSSIESWNTSLVTTMHSMFYYASGFNQPINSRDTSKVTSMTSMFNNARSFNQPINSRDTSKVTSMSSMFNEALSFNQPLNNWDTSKVIGMGGMFTNARSFNQPLNNWNTSSVTNMYGMFENVTGFNQSLGGWDMRSVTLATNMLSNTNLSVPNYDSTLSGWSSQALKPGITLGAQGLKFCGKELQRQSIITSYGWTFVGDSKNCSFNTAPTQILLSNHFLAENSATGSVIGTLSNNDPDTFHEFTYSFECAATGVDNSYFIISGSQLLSNISFDYEIPLDATTNNNYETCVRVNDGYVNYDQNITIAITDIDEIPPTGSGSISSPAASPTSTTDTDLIGSCGLDAGSGSVTITTYTANGFFTGYNTLIPLDYDGNFILTGLIWNIGNYDIIMKCYDRVGNGPTITTLTSAVNIVTPPTFHTGITITLAPQGGGGGGGAQSNNTSEAPLFDISIIKDTTLDTTKTSDTSSQISTTSSNNNTSTTSSKPNTSHFPLNPIIENNTCFALEQTKKLDSILDVDSEFVNAMQMMMAYRITRKTKINEYELHSGLTRAQAARFMSQFALNALCRIPDSNIQVDYTDLDTADNTLIEDIILAKQLGIMKGGPNNTFRPNDYLTRAEFIAGLVRLLSNNQLDEDNTNRRKNYDIVARKQLLIKTDTDMNTVLTRMDAGLLLRRAYQLQTLEVHSITKSVVLPLN